MIAPNPDGVNLTKTVEGLDHFGNTVVSQVIEEKPLTIYLNSQEIVTAMTIGDYPEYLAVGFLRNQGMLDGLNTVSSVDYDEDLSVVVVRTKTKTRTLFGDFVSVLFPILLFAIGLFLSCVFCRNEHGLI